MPGIENVQGKARPQAISDVRYYQADEARGKDVEKISDVLLKDFGVKLKPISLPPSSKARPRHYEIWFGDDFSPAPADSSDKTPLRDAPARRQQRASP